MMELVRIFKTLADETRFKLVKLLLTHDLCVGALAKHLRISEAAVSQHLKSLREAGLVRGEKRGYWTHYTVEKEKLHELAGLLRDLTDLPACSEGVCIKKMNNKIDCHKEEAKMCDCKCEHPEKLKGTPEECTLEQIKECHGDVKKHACAGEKKQG
jgi:ArsR family transcriptional regulator